jgi:CHAD domain-containing protein
MKEEMRDHREVEWQFDALDVRPVGRWLQGDSLGRNPSVVSHETRELADGYFDTEDWRIYRAGYALRIRRTKYENGAEAHDMRVAARRIRAAIKIFEGTLPVRARGFRDTFKWVAGALGEVRDLDVQLGRLEAWISDAAPEDEEPLEALRAVLEEQRAKARKAMLRTLDSRRYARFVASFGSFLEKGPSRRAAGARQPIMEAAPDLVRKPYRKVRKLGDPLTEESSGEEYHELRKKGKRLRYTLEFLSGVYGDAPKDMIGALKNLQDVLGDHQDAEVAASYLRELGVARGRGRRLPPETIFVMGGISHRYEVQARGLRANYPKAYRRAVGKRWKKLRSVIEKARPRQQ